jgi:hypothetical protein
MSFIIIEEMRSLIAKPDQLEHFIETLPLDSFRPFSCTAQDFYTIFLCLNTLVLKNKLFHLFMPGFKIQYINDLYMILWLLKPYPQLQDHFLTNLKLKNLSFQSFAEPEIVSLFYAISEIELKRRFFNLILPTFLFKNGEELNNVLLGLKTAGFSREERSQLIHQFNSAHCVQLQLSPTSLELVLSNTPASAQDYLLSTLPIHEVRVCFGRARPYQNDKLLKRLCQYFIPVLDFRDLIFRKGDELSRFLYLLKISDFSENFIHQLNPTHCIQIQLSLSSMDEILLNTPKSKHDYLLSILPPHELRRCFHMAHPYQDASLCRRLGQYFISSLDFRKQSQRFFAQFNRVPLREEKVEFTQEELADIQNNRIMHRGY